MSLTLRSAPDVLDPQQVAEVLGLGRTATYAALRAGDLPGVKVGGQWRVPKARLLQRLGLDGAEGPPGNGLPPDPQQEAGG